jgi:hypothetical protein
MGAAGIDVSRVAGDAKLKTGLTVSITSPHDRALVSHLGSIRALRADDVPSSTFAGFDHLHVSSYFLQEGLRPGLRGLFARAHAAGLTTSLDPGFDPSERWEADIVSTLAETDLFFPNEVEVTAITRRGNIAEALRQLENGRTRVIAKLGPEGCMTLEDGQPSPSSPSASIRWTPRAPATPSTRGSCTRLRGRPCANRCAGARLRKPASAGLGGTSRQADPPRSSGWSRPSRDHGRRVQHVRRQDARARRPAAGYGAPRETRAVLARGQGPARRAHGGGAGGAGPPRRAHRRRAPGRIRIGAPRPWRRLHGRGSEGRAAHLPGPARPGRRADHRDPEPGPRWTRRRARSCAPAS